VSGPEDRRLRGIIRPHLLLAEGPDDEAVTRRLLRDTGLAVQDATDGRRGDAGADGDIADRGRLDAIAHRPDRPDDRNREPASLTANSLTTRLRRPASNPTSMLSLPLVRAIVPVR